MAPNNAASTTEEEKLNSSYPFSNNQRVSTAGPMMQPKKSAETLMLPEDADQQPFCFSMISPTSIKGGAASQMSVEAMVRAPNSIAV